MKEYTIALDETVVEFLHYVSKSRNMSIEEVIESVVFKQFTKICEQITEFFVIKETVTNPVLIPKAQELKTNKTHAYCTQ